MEKDQMNDLKEGNSVSGKHFLFSFSSPEDLNKTSLPPVFFFFFEKEGTAFF